MNSHAGTRHAPAPERLRSRSRRLSPAAKLLLSALLVLAALCLCARAGLTGCTRSSRPATAAAPVQTGNAVYYMAQDETPVRRFVFDGVSWTKETLGAVDVGPNLRVKSLEIGDARNDGRRRLYVVADKLYEFTLDGTAWVRRVVITQQPYAVDIGDGDNDGANEIYAGVGNQVIQLKWDGNAWVSAAVGEAGGFDVVCQPVVGDVEGHDGLNEVYASGYDPDIQNKGFVQFKWGGGGWARTVLGGAEQPYYGVDIGDGDNDGQNEVYQMNANFPLFQWDWSPSGFTKTGINSYFLPSYPEVADADNNGSNEVYVVRESTAALWRHWWDGGAWQGEEIPGPKTWRKGVGDGDNDGLKEIYAGETTLYKVSWDGSAWVSAPLGPASSNAVRFVVVGTVDDTSAPPPTPTPTPQLVSIEVLPADPTIAAGQTQQFTAVGTYSDGSTRNLVSGANTWTSKAPMPEAKRRAKAVALNNQFYTLGGVTNAVVSTVESYDPATDSWAARPPMPTPRAMHGVGVIGNTLYVVGGCAGNCSNVTAALDAYDPVANSWVAKPPMPTARFDVGAGAIDGILYVVGGQNQGPPVAYNVLEAYNPATNSWATLAPMTFTRTDFGTGVAGGKLYVIGGHPFQATVEEYDPATNTWTTKAPMPTARCCLSVAEVAGKLYVSGGFDEEINNLATVEVYDPATDTWATAPPMPAARNDHGSASINGTIYAAGGGNVPVNTLFAITPGEVAWTSDATGVAAIDERGLATAIAPGTTTITATSGGVSGSTTLTVSEPPAPTQTPSFGNLSSPTIVYGTAETILAGNIGGAAGVPTGEVEVTLDGVTLSAPVEADGSFSVVFGTATLGAAGSPHAVSYDYAGDETYAPASAAGTLNVTRAAARLKIFGGTFAFDGQPHPATGTVTGANGEDLGPPSFTYDGVAAAPSAVGVYAVSAAFAGDANHEPASNSSVSIYINAGIPAPGGVGTYAVTQLGTLGGATSTATAVNASGRVVGYSETASGATHAFLYDAGTMSDLGTLPGGAFSYATAVNDSGQVVGVSGTAGGQSHAFLYSGGVMTDLGTLGGADSFAYDINNLGQIAGESQTAGGDSHAFLYSAGTMSDLGTLPGGTYSAANALNDAGQLTGYSQTGAGGEHAFLYEGGAMTDLGTLPGDAFSTGSGIDGAGRVVGYSFDPSGATHGFLYDGATRHDLGVLSNASDFGRALSISDAGAIVGHSTTAAGDSHGFIFDRTDGLRDLNPLLPAAANVTLASANGINSGGQIAGAGDDGGGQTRALLLTPVSATATALASSANPSAYGQTVTFTATVTSAGGTPAGTVQFFDGATSLGTSALSGGSASFSTSALAVATHNVKATYSGSATFTGSTSPTVAQVVQKADTTTALVSTANPSIYRQPVTFRATVGASAPGSGTPGGAVQFFDGSTLLGQVSLSGGVASLTTSALTTGTHNVKAEYRGNANFNVSASPALAQQVNPAPTVTRLNSSANPSVFGQAVTFRATVTTAPPGGGVPVGSVQFFDGATLLGTRGLTNGSATFGITTLSVGTHGITARYLGTVNHVASNSGTLSQVVRRASTTTAVTGPASSSVGQTVTFTAKVTAVAPGTGVPTGTVQFRINGVNAPGGLRTLSAGAAVYTTSSLPVGTSTVTAVYNGSVNFNTSGGSLIHRRR